MWSTGWKMPKQIDEHAAMSTIHLEIAKAMADRVSPELTGAKVRRCTQGRSWTPPKLGEDCTNNGGNAIVPAEFVGANRCHSQTRR